MRTITHVLASLNVFVGLLCILVSNCPIVGALNLAVAVYLTIGLYLEDRK